MKSWMYPLLLLALMPFSFKTIGQVNSPTVEEPHNVSYDSLSTLLEKMYDADQAIRDKLSVAGFDSPEGQQLMAEIIHVDSANQVHIKEVLNTYGWLPKSKIGEKASDAIFYVIQHSNTELMAKYFPQLQALAQIGEARMSHAAMMEDRLLMWQGKKQKYGTQAFSNSPDGSNLFIWPIENSDSVNQLREAAGFDLTVEEYAASHHVVYDKEQALPN